jgi:GTP pyrophosphokinase
VAQIAAEEIGLGTTSIVCALLHDVVEDTDITLEDIEREFGKKVAKIIDGLTKISGVFDYNSSLQAENFRKMLLTLADDVRVILIKLADRLHNMRTMDYMPRDKQLKISSETIYLYAPLAHRLGLYTLKSELEDLAMKYTEPATYKFIAQQLNEKKAERENFIKDFISPIKEILNEQGLEADLYGRPKSIHSIWTKMRKKNIPFDEVYDLFAVRVILNSRPENEKSDCWKAYSIVTDLYRPNPDRLRDWISSPRANGYESLHTTVMGPRGQWVEVQIRTNRMNEIAEKGFAAHWKYKLSGSTRSADSPDMLWLKQLHEWQQETSDVTEFLDALRFDLRTPETFVFTPKGSVIALPLGATAVDFAYAVHTDVGNRCVGAKVNGKLVSLEVPLVNGDVVEVLTNKAESASPSRDWLNFVKSSRARSKIKAWFSKERREEAIDAGRESIARQMRKAGLPLQKILGGHSLLQLAHELNYTDIEALYAAVGDGHISANHVIERLESSLGLAETYDSPIDENITTTSPSRINRRSASGIIVEGVEDVLVKLARCCTPVPGDFITGFITRGSGVSVHRSDCVNVADLKFHQGDRITVVRWDEGAKTVFLVNIQIEALDRARLLSDITRALSDQEINIVHAAVNTTKDQVAFSRFTFEMADASHLESVLASVKKIEGVYDVYRITNN